MTTTFRRPAERRNNGVWETFCLAENCAKRVPFRLIAPQDEMLTPPTKLQTFFFGICITKVRIDPKHDVDVIPGDFHPLDQSAD